MPNKAPRNHRSPYGERGTALLEAVIALGLLALIGAAGLTAFSAAGRSSAAAEARLTALGTAQNALERASIPAFLATARDTGTATLAGPAWRVTAAPYEGDDGMGPLALIHLVAEAGPEGTSLVRLETLRSLPR